VSAVVEGEGCTIDALGIVLTDHQTVLELNERHLGRSYLTDVIAFDLRQSAEAAVVDGEIYVDLDTAAERAPEFSTKYSEEVRRYVIHGLLHLIGYRDDSEAGAEEMKALENKYLAE